MRPSRCHFVPRCVNATHLNVKHVVVVCVIVCLCRTLIIYNPLCNTNLQRSALQRRHHAHAVDTSAFNLFGICVRKYARRMRMHLTPHANTLDLRSSWRM